MPVSRMLVIIITMFLAFVILLYVLLYYSEISVGGVDKILQLADSMFE